MPSKPEILGDEGSSWLFHDQQNAAWVRLSADRQQVEMWSTRRLPFEPTGLMRDARDAARSALSQLSPTADQIVDASYYSKVAGFVDTENVLFYNVGPAAFASVCRTGLRFTREFALPPAAPAIEAPFQHYHRYRLGKPSPPLSCEELSLHMRFVIAKLSTSTKPHDLWWAAKNGLAEFGRPLGALRKFALDVSVAGAFAGLNCAAILKPLFDGIISALHFDSAIDDTDPVCNLLAGRLAQTPAVIGTALRESRFPILGQRRVVSRYRDFVKWNPEDELCLTGQLLAKTTERPEFEVTAMITGIS